MFLLFFLISICLFAFFVFINLRVFTYISSLIFLILSLFFMKSPKTTFKSVKVLLIFSLCVVTLVVLSMLLSSTEKFEGKSDCIIVLGAGLYGDKPSPTLMNRLNAAIKLNEINPDTKIIVSGGQGVNETVSEAFAMRKYLIERGIDLNLIILEDKSTSTRENIKFSTELINKNNIGKNVTIVSSDFHILRGKFLSILYGLNPKGYGCKTLDYLVPAYFSREVISLIKDILLSPFYN